ncbi:hypothetical protein ACFWU3_26645 [Streptomyces sp. NPDC058685]|uniref:hypothetical protein n=1 Tax=Streptomyces sp. NPDC058685 TaxID=3346598 RepID=UPI00365C509B
MPGPVNYDRAQDLHQHVHAGGAALLAQMLDPLLRQALSGDVVAGVLLKEQVRSQ